jgi:hypothetical protein
MRVDTREAKAPTKRDPKARYRNFVKLAAEHRVVWGLFRDGWALSRDEKGLITFPLWAEREQAERSAKGPWQGYEAAEIPLEDLLEQLLPQLAKDDVKASLSPLADEAGLTPSIAQLIHDLEHELDPSGSEDDA